MKPKKPKIRHVPARFWDDKVYSLIADKGLATRSAIGRELPECGHSMLDLAFIRLQDEGRIYKIARGWYVPCA